MSVESIESRIIEKLRIDLAGEKERGLKLHREAVQLKATVQHLEGVVDKTITAAKKAFSAYEELITKNALEAQRLVNDPAALQEVLDDYMNGVPNEDKVYYHLRPEQIQAAQGKLTAGIPGLP